MKLLTLAGFLSLVFSLNSYAETNIDRLNSIVPRPTLSGNEKLEAISKIKQNVAPIVQEMALSLINNAPVKKVYLDQGNVVISIGTSDMILNIDQSGGSDPRDYFSDQFKIKEVNVPFPGSKDVTKEAFAKSSSATFGSNMYFYSEKYLQWADSNKFHLRSAADSFMTDETGDNQYFDGKFGKCFTMTKNLTSRNKLGFKRHTTAQVKYFICDNGSTFDEKEIGFGLNMCSAQACYGSRHANWGIYYKN